MYDLNIYYDIKLQYAQCKLASCNENDYFSKLITVIKIIIILKNSELSELKT